MFYFLSKAIDFVAMPLSIVFFLLLYSLFVKNRKRGKSAAIIGFVLLYLISNTFLVNSALNWWEPKPVNMSELNGTYDVGVLLSGGLMDANHPAEDHAVLGKRGDRVLQTYLLYKAGKIKKILITGSSSSELMLEGKGETRQAADLMVQWGVPAADILFEEKARNTRENAMFSSIILKKRYPAGKFLLITSAFHMRRSAGCFAKVGIHAATFPADFYGGYYSLRLHDFLVPSPDAIASFSMLWHEWIGNIVYKLVGYT
ncbi:YdcF family protein [Dyadobacter chenwenxiniae]|uniref:YdcF family protein n=1 Tax=Dyadobacter chenwenxiniae TaxID=2906456 RepID=A0A9X1PME4_9BACT|nr:YdcF family protein [Dyadobacter chenwenxiniae]MCF0063992.1 YdcF family protein [Dyadobacter chenwenxiniae]UON82720.1 YdcF family protein [Dyadobacter chenwenxiniae]